MWRRGRDVMNPLMPADRTKGLKKIKPKKYRINKMIRLFTSGERVFAKAIAVLKLKAHISIKAAPMSLGETSRLKIAVWIPFIS